MKLRLSILALAALAMTWLAPLSFAPPVAGEVFQAGVETNGWVLFIDVGAQTSTNGPFAFGWQTNNTAGTNVALTLTSQGFTTNGVATTRTRTIYGTKQLRFPYNTNGQSTANYISDVTTPSGFDKRIRSAISEWIFAGDSNLALNVAANWYSNSIATNGLVVTNYSTQTYPKVVGKWLQPNWQRVTSNSMVLRAAAFQMFATNYAPVACVQFWATDAHGHSVTNIVRQMTIDPTQGDAVPVPEYVATLDVSTLTQGDIVTNNFKAFPWIGDSTSVLDTSDGLWSVGVPYHYPHTYLLDQTNLYGTSIAYVNTNGGTSNGKVITTNFDTGNLPAAFASISQAAAAIAKTNAILFGGLSRSNAAGGIIVLRGNNPWVGTAGSHPSTRGNTYLTITNYPGETPTIVDGTGGGDINGLIRICGTKIISPDNFTFSAVSNIWFDRCVFDIPTSTGGDLLDGQGVHFMTQCIVSNWDQGVLQQGVQNTQFHLIRGCTFLGACKAVQPYCYVGNLMDRGGAATTNQFIGTDLSLPKSPQEIVVYCNRFMRLSYYSLTFASFYGSTICSNGAVIAQNVFESINTNSGDGLLLIHGDSASSNVTNLMYWNNTTAGAKTSDFYDDLGTSPHRTILCSLYNNLSSDYNLKSDTFSGNSLDGRRTGNWPVLYGVQCKGNGWMEYGAGAPGNFIMEFAGPGSYQPTINVNTQPVSGPTNTFGYASYIYDASWDGIVTVPPVGGGNYRLQPSSPILAIRNYVKTLPYDIAGKPRSRNAAGAYEAQAVTFIGGGGTTYVVPGTTTYLSQ